MDDGGAEQGEDESLRLGAAVSAAMTFQFLARGSMGKRRGRITRNLFEADPSIRGRHGAAHADDRFPRRKSSRCPACNLLGWRAWYVASGWQSGSPRCG